MLAFRKFWEVCWILAILIGIESCQDPDKNKEPVSKTDPENLVKTDGDKNEVKDEDKKEDENSTDILNSWSFVNPECHIANDEYGTFLLHINAYSIIREHTLYSDPYCQNITEKHTEEFGGQIKNKATINTFLTWWNNEIILLYMKKNMLLNSTRVISRGLNRIDLLDKSGKLVNQDIYLKMKMRWKTLKD